MECSTNELSGSGSGSLIGRCPYRTVRAKGVGGVQQLPMKKAGTKQRLTRQTRDKSMTLAAARIAPTSPVKMTPVPKCMTTRNQARRQIITAATNKYANSDRPVDDIYPRPKAPTTATSQSKPGITISGRGSVVGRTGKIPVSSPKPSSQGLVSVKALPPRSSQVSTLKPFAKATPASTSSSMTASTVVVPSTPTVSSSSQVTASPLASTVGAEVGTTTTSSFVTVKSRGEKEMQTERLDIFTDQHFLEIVRPQMAEMNPRQKLNFKKKVLHSLIETFDDATDFPNAEELQHFNINTPSGFEDVSDGEMRLMRELASLVCSAKRSDAISKSTPLPVVADTLRPVVQPKTPAPVPVPQPCYVIRRTTTQGKVVNVVTSSEEKEKEIGRNAKPSGAVTIVSLGVNSPTEELGKKSASNCSGASVSRVSRAPMGGSRKVTEGASPMNTPFGSTPPQVLLAKHGPLKVRTKPSEFSVCEPMLTLGMGMGMVPDYQRPRYSRTVAPGPGSIAGQAAAAAAPHDRKMRKSTGSVSASQEQPPPPGLALKGLLQPKPATGSPLSGGPGLSLKRSLPLANAQKSMADVVADPQEQEMRRTQGSEEYMETAGTIAANDLSGLLKEDFDDILGM
ncbi:probable GPI-anchored adhesin-like protein PGA55 isoform X1 [Drosophila pseudoobscura]|uniref:Probable GPI-anchored adhesin-like protein PGA55 isoform X1 n=1 Tax=Drosophila pseudoobscura pseudoobscura TaxID=46245 RepID=A0A6I8WDV4_DROPS|nr:probable GPI-anchored adhesin-like protein PGA55 isoform X1 [Drosophila pseudoobscura]XP_033241616.1 probable GPI-anchored adhesin-like protein PGA55 isoform X1 [Drosophila pseudoobscura]